MSAPTSFVGCIVYIAKSSSLSQQLIDLSRNYRSISENTTINMAATERTYTYETDTFAHHSMRSDQISTMISLHESTDDFRLPYVAQWWTLRRI